MHRESLWALSSGLDIQRRRVRLERDLSVCNVTLVIWRVEVHAIPARRECYLRTNAAGTWAQRQVGGILFGAWRAAEGRGVEVNAAVTDAAGFIGGVTQDGVAGEHAEALAEVSDFSS